MLFALLLKNCAIVRSIAVKTYNNLAPAFLISSCWKPRKGLEPISTEILALKLVTDSTKTSLFRKLPKLESYLNPAIQCNLGQNKFS